MPDVSRERLRVYRGVHLLGDGDSLRAACRRAAPARMPVATRRLAARAPPRRRLTAPPRACLRRTVEGTYFRRAKHNPQFVRVQVDEGVPSEASSDSESGGTADSQDGSEPGTRRRFYWAEVSATHTRPRPPSPASPACSHGAPAAALLLHDARRARQQARVHPLPGRSQRSTASTTTATGCCARFECRACTRAAASARAPAPPSPALPAAPPSPPARYTVRKPKSELCGAAAKYGGEAYYQVCSIDAIVHRAPLVPSPTRWSPERGDDEDVCDVWYLLEDLHAARRVGDGARLTDCQGACIVRTCTRHYTTRQARDDGCAQHAMTPSRRA